MTPWMEPLPVLISWAIALMAVAAGIRGLLGMRNRISRRRSDGPARPSAQGPGAFARILGSADSGSAYARDQIQERLRTLAVDIAAMERGVEDKASRKAVEQELLSGSGDLAAYLGEDHAGFAGHSRSQGNAKHDGFLGRTTPVLDQLKRRIKGGMKETGS